MRTVTQRSGGLSIKKTITRWRPTVFSRHPSHRILRTSLELRPFKSVIRLGSTTPHTGTRVEINTVQGVVNSSSKLLMKKCFTQGNVRTANWYTYRNGQFHIASGNTTIHTEDLVFPIIAKSHRGSRGEGNSLLNNRQELEAFVRNHTTGNYIFEQYYNYSKEYRIHVSRFGCFYTCRKVIRRGTPEDNRWQRHDDNCNWLIETNPEFDRPNNWSTIVDDCVRALNSLGLDIAGFDVKVQANTNRERRRDNPEYIIIESCSAPSFGEVTGQKYTAEINRLLTYKYNNR